MMEYSISYRNICLGFCFLDIFYLNRWERKSKALDWLMEMLCPPQCERGPSVWQRWNNPVDVTSQTTFLRWQIIWRMFIVKTWCVVTRTGKLPFKCQGFVVDLIIILFWFVLMVNILFFGRQSSKGHKSGGACHDIFVDVRGQVTWGDC